MVEQMIVEARTDENVRVRVVWNDDEPQTVLDVKRPGYCRRLIVEWAAQGVESAEIVARLSTLSLLLTAAAHGTASRKR